MQIKKLICLTALMAFGHLYARDTQLVRTMSVFRKVLGRGPTVVLVYALNPDELTETKLPDGTSAHTPAWHAVDSADDMISGLPGENDHGEAINSIRVNLVRRDLGRLRRKYDITGTSMLLFMNSELVGKPIPVGPDFNLSKFTTSDSWLKFKSTRSAGPTFAKRCRWIVGGVASEWLAVGLLNMGAVNLAFFSWGFFSGGVGVAIGCGIGAVTAGVYGMYRIYHGLKWW